MAIGDPGSRELAGIEEKLDPGTRQTRSVETRCTGLPRAKDFAGPAVREILFGHSKPITGVDQDL